MWSCVNTLPWNPTAQHVLKALLISGVKTVAWKLIQWVLKATAPPIQSQHIRRVPRFWMSTEAKLS